MEEQFLKLNMLTTGILTVVFFSFAALSVLLTQLFRRVLSI